MVPIFQAPDEHSHFDFAVTVYGAGPAGLRGHPIDDYYWMAHPYSRYLLRATGFLDLITHPDVHVQDGYGTSSYYAALDRGAPRVPDPLPLTYDPYLASAYPIGYYALVAAWLRALTPAGLGVVGLFFAARLLSVLMLAVTLPLTYLVAREVGVRRWVALAMTAVIGFLPLTSFVASYVQPDNLSWLLVTVAVFLALRGRRFGFSRSWLLAEGAALGGLLATKQVYYVCLLPAIAAMIASERWYQGRRWRGPRWPAAAAALLGPSLLLAGLASLAVWPAIPYPGAVHKTQNVAHISTAALATAVEQGPGAAFFYVVTSVQDAFSNFYFGTTMLTFWNTFGWLDVAVTIRSARVGAVVHDAIVGVTVVIFVLMLLRLETSAQRLFRVARRGRPRTALRLACANPFLNAYLAFIVVMFSLYVVTGGSFGPQGRNWIPFLFPIFSVGVLHAPRVLAGTRVRKAAGGAVLLGLALYSAAAAYSAPGDIRARYYGPPPNVSSLELAGVAKPAPGLAYAIERIDGSQWPRVPAESYVTVEGWAFDREAGAPPGGLVASLDNGVRFPGVVGLPHPALTDGARAIPSGAGFRVALAATGLAPGPHTITLAFEAPDGSGYFEAAPIPFEVADEGGGASP